MDEMLEKVPEYLKGTGVECTTIHESILGSKQKTRKVKDSEVRKFLAEQKAMGIEITLVTNDEESCNQIRADDLPVLYVPELIRDYILRKQRS